MTDQNQTTDSDLPTVAEVRGILEGYGPSDPVAPLRAAIWRAMMEIENDGADQAYETLRYAWENSR